MGFHTRHIDENYLRTVYESKGKNGIMMLYYTADAIDSQDEFSSEVTDLFCRNLSKEEIGEALLTKFDSETFSSKVSRKMNAFKLFSEHGMEVALRLYPEEENFLITNQRMPWEEVEKMLTQQL